MRISLARLRTASEEKKIILIFLKEGFQVNLKGGIQPPIIGQETGASHCAVEYSGNHE